MDTINNLPENNNTPEIHEIQVSGLTPIFGETEERAAYGEFIISKWEYADLIRKETLLDVIMDYRERGTALYGLESVVDCTRRLLGKEKPATVDPSPADGEQAD